ncbi:MAG: 4Fe-4S binding protein [Deltaproteobacteria bacterium]|nr:4Fe-4S binding protein [Deltaproteobacteria bacterium]
MGRERYQYFVERAKSTLTYDPGWSHDNPTGTWRTMRPIKTDAKCTSCDLCWLLCPEGSVSRGSYAIDYDYCKGCGICAHECRAGVIVMEREAG